MTTVTMILVASLLLQCIAVVLAVWLIRITGRWRAWSFIAAAILLMSVRGSISMHRWVSRDPSHMLDVAFEVECLVGSALIVAGVGSLIPLFRSIERSRAELRESTEFASSLLSNAPNPIIVINPDTSIRYVNPALERLTGFSSGEIVGRKIPYPWWVEGSTQRATEQLEAALRTGVQRLEMPFQSKNGRRFWVEITSTQVSHGGEFNYYVGNWVDVTERKQAEESLKSERDKLQSLMDGLARTGIGVDVVGVDYRIVSQNDILKQRFGDGAGKLCYEVYMKRSEPCDFCRLQETIRERKTYRVAVVGADGRDYEVYSGPFRNPDGTVDKVAEVVVDVTDHKRVAELLRRERDFAESLVETAQVIVLVLDTAGRIVRFNPYMEEISGYCLEDVRGNDWFTTFLPGRDQGHIRTLFSQAVSDIHVRGNVNALVTKGGDEREIEWYAKSLKDGNGTVVGVLSVGQDITDRKRAAEELARYRDHLEELVEQRTRELADSREKVRQAERLASIGTLAAGIAHEINNPVGGILIAAQGALGEIDESLRRSYVARCLNEIVEDAKRCSRIVKSVLRFARDEPTEKWPSDVNGVVARSVDLTRELVDTRGAKVTLQLGEDLSAVPLNPIEFEQVLVNLITNAVEAAGERARVRVRTERLDSAVRVTVADDGPGIPPERLKHVFDPFYTTRLRTGGTGLGLSVVHGIIQAHGGSIDVKSQPGLGTVFTIDLPC